ncbi:MAG: hypothetical protein QM737_18740 [Ferruginibacter sp.]
MNIILQVLTRSDSSILFEINKIEEKIDTIGKKADGFQWSTIIPVIIGGLLVWIGQYLERVYKRKYEEQKELRDLVTKCETLFINICNALKELSTQKNLRTYWWYCYKDEFEASIGKDIENQKIYFENHKNASIATIQIGLKIGDLLSEYYSGILKFKLISKTTFDDSDVKKLFMLELSNAKKIAVGLDIDQALTEYENNRTELFNEYYNKFKLLEVLNENLKQNLKQRK